MLGKNVPVLIVDLPTKDLEYYRNKYNNQCVTRPLIKSLEEDILSLERECYINNGLSDEDNECYSYLEAIMHTYGGYYS